MTSKKHVKIALAFIIAVVFIPAMALSTGVFGEAKILGLELGVKKASACSSGYDYGCGFGGNSWDGGFNQGCGVGCGGYNYVQYPNLNYVYNQNPVGQNNGGGYNFVQYPNLSYVYNQDPSRQNAGSSYNFVQYPRLKYVYYQDPSRRNVMDDYNYTYTQYPNLKYVYYGQGAQGSQVSSTAQNGVARNSQPQTDWMSVFSNPIQPQYNYANAGYGYGMGNVYGVGGGFTLVSGF